MATLKPIDFDPSAGPATGPKLVPIDFDPSAGGGVGKAFLSGAERGAAAIPGVFGDIQELSRAAGKKLGFEPPKRSVLDRAATALGFEKVPTSVDTISAASKVLPDINYQPKTTGERFASTIGSFIPGSLLAGGGGGLLRNAIQYGVIPGATSEAAGELTKGTSAEPWARAAGGLLGGMIGPSVTNIPGRVVSPITQNPAVARQAAAVEAEGIPLTAGQRTGSKALQWLESTAMDQPLASRSAEDVARQQGEAVTRAMTRRMEYEQPQMEPAHWTAARQNLSGQYDALTRPNVANLDPQLVAGIQAATGKYRSLVPPSQQAPIVAQWENDIMGRAQPMPGVSGQLPGAEYQSWRSQLTDQAKGPPDKTTDALKAIRNELDAAMERSLSTQDRGKFAELNRKWAALKTLQEAATKAGAETAQGFISPKAVRSAAARRNPTAYLEGKSDLGELAKNIEAVGAKLPQSGTQPRTQAQHLLNLGGIPAALATGGAALGGIPGAVVGAVTPTIMGRAIMSRPIQSYLGNQAASRLGLLSNPSEDQRVRGLLSDLIAAQIEGPRSQ